MDVENFWIMEDEVIPFYTTPVKFVISNPEIFDIDVEEMYETIPVHQEYDGFTRWRIKLELFRSGWILASHQYPEDGDRWSFEFATFVEAIDPITSFLRKYYGDLLFLPESPVELRGQDDQYFKFYPRSEGGVSAFLGRYILVASD